MGDVLLGIVAVFVGGVLCLRGYAALRVVIALWGAFAGFVVGASLLARFTEETFLGSPLGWLVGLGVGIVFGLVAYLYYVVSVVIGMAAIGFAIGTTVMIALGATWSWAILTVGVLLGLGLAVLAVAGDLPLIILAFLGAFAGASTVLAGVLLLIGTIDREDVVSAGPTTLALHPLWAVAYLALGLLGLVVQLRHAEAREGTLRDAWSRA